MGRLFYVFNYGDVSTSLSDKTTVRCTDAVAVISIYPEKNMCGFHCLDWTPPPMDVNMFYRNLFNYILFFIIENKQPRFL
jgi:hypothetical protein